MTLRARGRFVTLEGGEGAGKSTLAKGLAETLRARGTEVVTTREPGGSPGADEIRALLVTGATGRWSVLSEALLLSAARSDHLERTVRPALEAGSVVICDRYTDSFRAYQSAGRGLPARAVDTLTALIGADVPDLTLVLDIDPNLGIARSRGPSLQEARFEAMGHPFHARVRQAFLDIAAAEPARCRVLDASLPPEEVAAAALEALEALAPR